MMEQNPASRFLSKLVLGLIAAGVVVIATGCIVSVDPESAVNEVGTEHTVVVTLRTEEDFLGLLTVLPTSIIGETQQIQTAQEEEFVTFDIVAGPNKGIHSDNDCEPSCSFPDANNQISWTYRSNGVPGTDTILVCTLEGDDIDQTLELLDLVLDEINVTEDDFIDLLNEGLDEHYANLEDIFCSTVTKTWVQPQNNQRPNIGAGLSGLFAGGGPAATPVAPAAVAPSTNTTIRPPNTGDGGLR